MENNEKSYYISTMACVIPSGPLLFFEQIQCVSSKQGYLYTWNVCNCIKKDLFRSLFFRNKFERGLILTKHARKYLGTAKMNKTSNLA